MIQDDCEELAVSLYPCGGFSSITFAYEAAHPSRLGHRSGGSDVTNYDLACKLGVIFYIGDYDPAGVLIDRSLYSRTAHAPP